MNKKKRRKLAMKTLDELLDSEYIVAKLKTIFMMNDYSDKAVKKLFKSFVKECHNMTEVDSSESMSMSDILRGKYRNDDDDDLDEEINIRYDNKHRSSKVSKKDPTKVTKVSKSEAIALDLDNIFNH